MNFIIQRFLNMLLRDYHIKYDHTTNRDFQTICLYDLDVKLEKILLNLSFQRIVGIRDIRSERNNIVRREPMTETCNCVVKMKRADGKDCLVLVLNEDDYGDKICKVDFAIREFLSKNSPIAAINKMA